MWDFFLYSSNMVYYIVYILYVKSTLHSWEKSHLVMVYSPFYLLLDFLCLHFVKFCAYTYHGYWSVVFFPLCYLYIALVSWPHRIKFKVFPLLVFGRVIKDCSSFFLQHLIECSYLGMGFVSSDFLFLLKSVLVVCIFLLIYPFHLGYLMCWCTVFIIFPYNFFPVKSVVPFSFLILVIRFFSLFSLFSLAKCWSIVLIFQRTNFWFC